MDPKLRKQLEEGTQMAFSKYRERHPGLSRYLERHHSDLMASTIESIENDPEVLAAIKSAKAENKLQKVIEAAAQYIPKIIGIL